MNDLYERIEDVETEMVYEHCEQVSCKVNTRNFMKNKLMMICVLLISMFLWSCTDGLDPLSPGSTVGRYSSGIKSLLPLVIGNQWTYSVTTYDTNAVEHGRFTYDLTVVGITIPDTMKIPLRWPMTNRKDLVSPWYLLRGESGISSYWQVDILDNLRHRKLYDTLYFEQTAFNFRAEVGDSISPVYVSADSIQWASGDIFYTSADSVRTSLFIKANDSLRTTLGSSPWYMYRESYVRSSQYTDYYFKPGFGLFLKEQFEKTTGGRIVKIRRDELVSYYLN